MRIRIKYLLAGRGVGGEDLVPEKKALVIHFDGPPLPSPLSLTLLSFAHFAYHSGSVCSTN